MTAGKFALYALVDVSPFHALCRYNHMYVRSEVKKFQQCEKLGTERCH